MGGGGGGGGVVSCPRKQCYDFVLDSYLDRSISRLRRANRHPAFHNRSPNLALFAVSKVYDALCLGENSGLHCSGICIMNNSPCLLSSSF